MDSSMYKTFHEIENHHWWFVARKKIILNLINKYKSSESNKVLDIGCGSGVILNDLKQYGHVYGMDCSEDAIKYSRLVFDGEVAYGYLAGGIPAAYSNFDIVLAADVLEHIDDDELALNEIREILSPTGFTVITVPAFMFLWSEHDDKNWHKRRYRINEIQKKLQKNHLEIVQISYYNCFLFLPAFIIRMMQKKLRKLKKTEYDDVKLPNKYLNWVLEKIFGLEDYLLQKNIRFPFGLSIIAVARKAM